MQDASHEGRVAAQLRKDLIYQDNMEPCSKDGGILSLTRSGDGADSFFNRGWGAFERRDTWYFELAA
jgi:hypothetical protein